MTDTTTQQEREAQMISVRASAVDWLKKHCPALCEKSGLCERVAGRLYTRTTLPQRDEPVSEGKVATVEAVATIVRTEDGLDIDWLVEGGIASMVEGETLLICGERLTDETGSGEVYTTPPSPSLREVQADALDAKRYRFARLGSMTAMVIETSGEILNAGHRYRPHELAMEWAEKIDAAIDAELARQEWNKP